MRAIARELEGDSQLETALKENDGKENETQE
jgi:hypothetical protein